MRVKPFRKPKGSEVDEVLLQWFKEYNNDNAPASVPLLIITFVLPVPKF